MRSSVQVSDEKGDLKISFSSVLLYDAMMGSDECFRDYDFGVTNIFFNGLT